MNRGKPTPRLIVITDVGVATVDEHEARIGRVLSLAAPNTVMVQLRDKELSAKGRIALGKRLVAACRRCHQWFVVNDRVDVALLLQADGVHLGEGGIAPSDARSLLPRDAWISVACHDPLAVHRPGVDGILLSPVVEPRKGRAPLGFEGLTPARERLRDAATGAVPALYALGGVDAQSVSRCLSSGADGVAVIGAVLDGSDPAPLLRALGVLAV